ncbi:unnamed protein product [Caenorhabditis brenneri]
MMQQALLSKSSTPLQPGTSEFEKLFTEALEHAKNNPNYEDRKIVYLHFYIFNPNVMKIPQKSQESSSYCQRYVLPMLRKTSFHYWQLAKNAANTKEFQEWMERAGELSAEILEQIKRGYIYDDTKMISVKSQPRYRMDDENGQGPAKVARASDN